MRALTLALVLALAAAGAARPQSLEDRLRSQLTATVAELRTVKAQQADLAAQKAQAERERDDLKSRLTAAQAKLRTARPAPAETTSASDIAQAKAQQLAQDQGLLDSTVAQSRQLTRDLAQLRADRDQQNALLAKHEQDLAVCQAKAIEAHDLARDILAAYDHVTGAGLIVRREPFTGLKRVQIQRLEQDFGDRLHHSRLDASPKPDSPSSAATPSAQSPPQ